MSRIHVYVGSALVALVIALGGLVAPLPAKAADVAPAAALGVSLHCESTGGGGYLCDAFPSGGVSPYSYTWTPGSNVTITQNLGSSVFGQCNIGTFASMRVTVKDSQNATATATRSFRCTSIAP